MMNLSHQIGSISEALVKLSLIQRGFQTFSPDNAVGNGVDLIALAPGGLPQRIQIKTVANRNNKKPFIVTSWVPYRKGLLKGVKRQPYTINQIDFILAVDSADVYVIPVSAITCTRMLVSNAAIYLNNFTPLQNTGFVQR